MSFSKLLKAIFKSINDPSVTHFFDKDVRLGGKYTYAIKYITTEGIHSVPTEIVVQY